jgi:hypothetical protein
VITDFSVLGAPIVMTAFYRLLQSTRPAWCNVVISNVPGPRNPIYCAGAAARHYFPLSIPFHGCALNITVQSYVDLLEFGLTACRATVPDVQLIADYLVEEFEGLRRAHEALSRPDAIEIIEIAAPAAAGLKRSKRTRRIAGKRAAAAKPVAVPARPASARPGTAAAAPPSTPARPAIAAAKPRPAQAKSRVAAAKPGARSQDAIRGRLGEPASSTRVGDNGKPRR